MKSVTVKVVLPRNSYDDALDIAKSRKVQIRTLIADVFEHWRATTGLSHLSEDLDKHPPETSPELEPASPSVPASASSGISLLPPPSVLFPDLTPGVEYVVQHFVSDTHLAELLNGGMTPVHIIQSRFCEPNQYKGIVIFAKRKV
jgi:hypothetical protein